MKYLIQNFIPCSILLMIIFISGCGMVSPSYVDYTDKGSADGALTQEEYRITCQVGMDSFTGSLSTPIATSCATSGCHEVTKIAGGYLTPDNDDVDSVNRLILLNYNGSSLTKLFLKITDGPHSGGDFSSSFTEETIATWVTAENTCIPSQ